MEKNKFEVKRKEKGIGLRIFIKRLIVFSSLFFTGDTRKKVKKPLLGLVICMFI